MDSVLTAQKSKTNRQVSLPNGTKRKPSGSVLRIHTYSKRFSSQVLGKNRSTQKGVEEGKPRTHLLGNKMAPLCLKSLNEG